MTETKRKIKAKRAKDTGNIRMFNDEQAPPLYEEDDSETQAENSVTLRAVYRKPAGGYMLWVNPATDEYYISVMETAPSETEMTLLPDELEKFSRPVKLQEKISQSGFDLGEFSLELLEQLLWKRGLVAERVLDLETARFAKFIIDVLRRHKRR